MNHLNIGGVPPLSLVPSWGRRAGPALRITLILLGLLVLSWGTQCIGAQEVYQINGTGSRILSPPRLKAAADELFAMYPHIKQDVAGIFRWPVDVVPTVMLVGNGAKFQRMAGSPLIIAFAQPQRSLIVMDWSKLKHAPEDIQNIFKHELCHLLIHHHITQVPVPRWLDEGVAQWASDGVGDIILDQKRSQLNRVAFTGRFIPLRRLETGFPRKKQNLRLAYEESKSFTEYLVARFGKKGLLRLLDQMHKGDSVPRAAHHVFGVSIYELERDWQQSVKGRVSWFTYLSYYLYEILFALGGLMTLVAGIKVFLRKRAYMREEMETRFEEEYITPED